MKAVMYHYVRPGTPGLPHFPYLHLKDFHLQLDHFASTYSLVSRAEFTCWVEGGPVPQGVLLTFDDGLRDHVDFVLPVLCERNIFALFYVSSGPALTGRILDVHKLHLVLGRIGAASALTWLEAHAPEILPAAAVREQESQHYANLRADKTTKFLKHLFSWLGPDQARSAVLERLLDYAFAGELPNWRDVYLDEKAILALSEAGMGVGAHGHVHAVPALLGREQQRQEIELSCRFVENIVGSGMWGYCYPHGVPEALSPVSQMALADRGCPFAFVVEARDVIMPLRKMARYALPRYDCNAFPSGTVSYGTPSKS